MPRVRILADAVGRYEAGKGDVIEVTDSEAARWVEAGAVELVGKDAAAPASSSEPLSGAEAAAAAEDAEQKASKRTRSASARKAKSE